MITIYSKTGGRNGKHAAITDASNISAISYPGLGVQVFKHTYGCLFRDRPDATATFHTKQFALLTSNLNAFLSLLSSTPKICQPVQNWLKRMQNKSWKCHWAVVERKHIHGRNAVISQTWTNLTYRRWRVAYTLLALPKNTPPFVVVACTNVDLALQEARSGRPDKF